MLRWTKIINQIKSEPNALLTNRRPEQTFYGYQKLTSGMRAVSGQQLFLIHETVVEEIDWDDGCSVLICAGDMESNERYKRLPFDNCAVVYGRDAEESCIRILNEVFDTCGRVMDVLLRMQHRISCGQGIQKLVDDLAELTGLPVNVLDYSFSYIATSEPRKLTYEIRHEAANPVGAGHSVPQHMITIRDQYSWNTFAKYVNAGYVTAGCKWVLGTNVSVNSNNSINQVFYGTLEGGSDEGQTSLYKIGVSDHAVFETLGTGAVVENLNFDGTVTGSTAESAAFGCVANVVDGGTIRNCTINGASISVTAGSGSRIGSFVGLLKSGRIENCTFDGSVNFNVSGTGQNVSVGGIVGESKGTVSGCSNHMSISVSGLGSDCYVGAMVGKATDGSVVNCAFSGSIVTESTGDTAPKVGCVAGTATANVMISNCTNSSNVGWEVGTDKVEQVITINEPEQTTFTYSAGSIKVGTQEDADIRYTIASGYTAAVTVKWYLRVGENYEYQENGAINVGTYHFVIESSTREVLFRSQKNYEITPLVITDDMLDIKLGNMSLNPGEGNTVTYNGLERTLYYTHNGKTMTFDPFLTGDLTLLLDGTKEKTAGDRLQTMADYGQDISSRVVGKDAGAHTITFRASANVDASKLQGRTFEIQPKALSSGMLRYEPSSITYGDPIPALKFEDSATGLAFTLPGDNSTLCCIGTALR